MLWSQAPYSDMLPLDNAAANLRWRVKIREAAKDSPEIQAIFRQAAMRDILFFIAGFCWLFEPRPSPRIMPFVPWPHQIPAILTLDRWLGASDIGMDKSRGEGATWMCLMVILHRWLRDPMFAAGLVSRNENAVDLRDDPDSLMWKLDWTLARLPYWLLPKGWDPKTCRSYGTHTIRNPETDGTIVGYAATGEVASGGRKTCFFMDELAKFPRGSDYAAMDSTQHVTECRLLVSTYNGDYGAFFDSMREDTNIKKIILDWKDNPLRRKGLYKVVDGLPVVLEVKKNPLPKNYAVKNKLDLEKLARRGFIREGQIRSPWYDQQCLRPGASPRSIAQELDRDPHGTVSKVFDQRIIERMLQEKAQVPISIGRFVYDPEQCLPKGFVASEAGELRLWCNIGVACVPPDGSYVIGADISHGQGGDSSSNSVASVVDRQTGIQVAELVTATVLPSNFARLCVSMCRWFNNAYLIWEATGPPGEAFTKELMDKITYPNIYYREIEIEGLHRKTQRPGFWMGSDSTKLKIFEQMAMAMAGGEYIPRSKLMLEECRQYEWRDEKITFSAVKKGGGRGRAHGDRVIAASLTWVACEDRPLPRANDAVDENAIVDPPYLSMAWMLQQRDRDVGKIDPWTGEVFAGNDWSA